MLRFFFGCYVQNNSTAFLVKNWAFLSVSHTVQCCVKIKNDPPTDSYSLLAEEGTMVCVSLFTPYSPPFDFASTLHSLPCHISYVLQIDKYIGLTFICFTKI